MGWILPALMSSILYIHNMSFTLSCTTCLLSCTYTTCLLQSTPDFFRAHSDRNKRLSRLEGNTVSLLMVTLSWTLKLRCVVALHGCSFALLTLYSSALVPRNPSVFDSSVK